MAENKYGVELISGITPKNNGTFPLVHAKDVEMPDGTRLSELTIPDGGNSDNSVKTVNGVAPDQNGNVVIETDMNPIKEYIDEYISSALGGDY